MKLKFLYILFFFNFLIIVNTFTMVSPAHIPRVPVPPLLPALASADKILAIIYHTEGSSIILQSDLSANLEGITKTLKDVVLERLMVIDAENLKIAITQADIDRHLNQVQKLHNLSHEQTVELFNKMGLTFEQALQQLKTKLIIDTVLDHRVKKKLIIGTQLIQKYYDDHPVVKEAEYQISQAFVPHAGSSPTLQKIKIEQAIDSKEINTLVRWSELLTLKESEVAAEKAFIKSLSTDESAIANVSTEGISILRLISKKPSYLVPLKERETEIMNILGKELWEKVFAEYQEKLFKMARIKYIN